MANPRHTLTNAADSAPGVDDGRAGAPAPKIDSKPGGRAWVLLIVLISLVILALIFIAGPRRSQTDMNPKPAAATDAATSSDRP